MPANFDYDPEFGTIDPMAAPRDRFRGLRIFLTVVPRGTKMVLVDGTVRFLESTITGLLLGSLLTVAGNDDVVGDPY
jgi:hypothetical protein